MDRRDSVKKSVTGGDTQRWTRLPVLGVPRPRLDGHLTVRLDQPISFLFVGVLGEKLGVMGLVR